MTLKCICPKTWDRAERATGRERDPECPLHGVVEPLDTVVAKLQSAFESTGDRIAVGDWIHFHETDERFFRHFGRAGHPCPYCDEGNQPTRVLTFIALDGDVARWNVDERT